MALLQTKTGNGGGYVNSYGFSFTSSVTSTSLLVMVLSCGSGDTPSVSDSVNGAWSSAVSQSSASSNRKVVIFYKENSAAGSPTVTITFGAGQFVDSAYMAREYSGVSTSSSLDKTAGASDGGYVQTHTSGTTTTTAQANELIIAGMVVDTSSAAVSAGTGYGNVISQGGFDAYTGGAMEDRTVSATGTYNASFTTTGFHNGETVIATFKLAAASAPASAVTDVQISKGDTELLVYWNDTTGNGATSYKVQRSTSSGGTYTDVGTPTVTFYKDTGLTNGTTYYYKVVPVNSGGDGPATTPISLAPAARPTQFPDKWYPFGSMPTGFTQSNIRTWMRTHYDNWVTYCFTQTGASSAGKGAWRVKVPDQNDPVSGAPNGTFSEGIGYGMFVTAYMSRWENQKYDIYAKMYFDGMWRYYNYYKNANGLMNWRIDHNGNITGTGGATDGDVDVAIALIVAHKTHGSSGTFNYLSLGTSLINAIRDYEFVPISNATTAWRNLQMNGDGWGENTDRYMADYFSPAWMRIFQEITGDSRWQTIIDVNYALAVDYYYTNTSYGLIPDGSNRAGASNGSDAYKYGYNSIRRPWRLTADYLWFGDYRAFKSMYRMASDLKTRFSNTPANGLAEPALDWSTNGGYNNQAFTSGYGLTGVVHAGTADWAGNVADWLNTNYPGESSYFGASMGMLALLAMSGEMVSVSRNSNKGFL